MDDEEYRLIESIWVLLLSRRIPCDISKDINWYISITIKNRNENKAAYWKLKIVKTDVVLYRYYNDVPYSVDVPTSLLDPHCIDKLETHIKEVNGWN